MEHLAVYLPRFAKTGSALGSMVDFSAHRDQLATTNAIYK
jgi:hypothetical protein